MRRLYIPRALLGSADVTLGARDAHYVRDVLRLAPGSPVEVFDGEGGTYLARISGAGDALLLGARREVEHRAARIDLAFALARGDRCDVVVQKATELGVARLLPFAAARSVVRLAGERAGDRARRWERIAAEAARQCGRADVPAVAVPTGLGETLAAAQGGHVLVLYEGGGEPLGEAVDPAAPHHLLVIGPEGGFAPEEIRACVGRGARLVTLGPRVLRFETAAIVATALVQHLAGDLGTPHTDVRTK